jgi:hypothetical protein
VVITGHCQAEYLRGAAGLCAAGAEGAAAQVHQEQEGSHTQHHHVRQGDMRRSEVCKSVLRIRIRRISMFLGLPDPHPDLLVRDTDPDPSVLRQK